MAEQSFVQNASINITAAGNTTVNGTAVWSAPQLPAGAESWDSIAISASMYNWNGKGTFTLTINGVTCSSGASFNVSLPLNASSPYTITGRGNNKNATGANCQFTNLVVTYICTIRSNEKLMVKLSGEWLECRKVYRKQSGVWIEVTDLESLFDTSTNYILAGIDEV